MPERRLYIGRRSAGIEEVSIRSSDADAIMDRIVHNTLWIETGSTNMREHTAMTA